MVRWFSRLFYGAIPVRFVSTYSTDEAIARLSKIVKPSLLSSFSGQCAVGTVSRKKVRIQREIPFIGNAFKPIFYGTLSTCTAGTILEGTFKVSFFTRIFMSIWFGFLALWTLLASVATLEHAPLWFPLSGVAMLAVGIGMVQVGKWLSRNDVAWLTHLISQELGINDPQSKGQSTQGAERRN